MWTTWSFRCCNTCVKYTNRFYISTSAKNLIERATPIQAPSRRTAQIQLKQKQKLKLNGTQYLTDYKLSLFGAPSGRESELFGLPNKRLTHSAGSYRLSGNWEHTCQHENCWLYKIDKLLNNTKFLSFLFLLIYNHFNYFYNSI